MNVGQHIRKRRKELGLSVDDLAEALGKDRSTIYRYESNEIEKLPTTILEPLALALRTTPADLMGWNDASASTVSNNEHIRNIEKGSSDPNSFILDMYNSLDEIDQAEIRGEMKHMLKADKYADKKAIGL